MRGWREKKLGTKAGRFERSMLASWAYVATRPRLYHLAARVTVAALSAVSRSRGAFRRLPFVGAWTATRDFPAPQGRTFQQLWTEHRRGVPR